MRKIVIVITVLFWVNICFASFTVPTAKKQQPVETKTQREIALMEMVVKMSVKNYEVMN